MAKHVQSMATEFVNHDTVQLALSIPLLLEKILTELDNETVFNFRLVSRSWNIAALAIFPKRTIKGQPPRALILNKMFKSSEIHPNFDVKLAKVIEFRENCICNQNCGIEPCLFTRTRFLEFWGKYSNQIEIAKLSTPFISTLSRILSSSSKNLKAFVFYPCYTDLDVEAPELNIEQTFSRPNLHILYLTDALPTIFHKPIQTFISRAPNLKRLKFQDNFYPDLSKNKKLQYLRHYCDDSRTFVHKNLSRMLCQVKDSLETLKLCSQTDYNIYFDPKDFNFPRMPKLKKLINWDISLYPMQNENSNKTLFEILDSKFPALKNLYMRDFDKNGVQVFFDQLMQKEQRAQDKILSLGLEKVDNPSIFLHFKEWFPNLRKLNLCLSKPVIGTQDEDELVIENHFDSTFSKLGQLGLEHLVFRLDFKILLTNYVRALIKNVEIFKGLSSLHLHTKEEYDCIVDDLSCDDNLRKQFCEWLVDIAKNKSVVVFNGFSFSGETSWELMLAIREKNLPVKFVNEHL